MVCGAWEVGGEERWSNGERRGGGEDGRMGGCVRFFAIVDVGVWRMWEG